MAEMRKEETKKNNMEKSKVYTFDTIIYPFKIFVIINNNPEIISEYF